MKTLQELQKDFPKITWYNFHNVECIGIQNDSRKIEKGMIFVALNGTKEQGAKYIQDAIDKGAVAILAEQYNELNIDIPLGVVQNLRREIAFISQWFYDDPTKNMHLVGITGTNGKTTTTFLLESIFRQANCNAAILGTTGYYYGGQRHVSSHTTPDSIELNELFAEMKKCNTTHVAMEVSSHALVQDRVAHLSFEVGIFTNLSRDHLDYHLTMENYRDAKAILFKNLSPNAYAVLNADEESSNYFAKNTSASVVTYGMNNKNATIFVTDIMPTKDGSAFQISTPDGLQKIYLPMPGQYNIMNALAAITGAWKMGFSWHDIIEGLRHMRPVPGRLEKINVPYSVYVDYAHTDQALELSLRAIRALNPAKIILVFGCGGDRDKGKRPLMAKIASQYADTIFITNDNPRTEDPDAIIQDIIAGMTAPYTICLDRKQAIEKALSLATKEDIVLIAGKGHEDYQIIGTTKHYFSDQAVVLSFFNK